MKNGLVNRIKFTSVITGQKFNLPLKGIKQLMKQVSPGGLNWFQDARFGMFIHWGLYSILAPANG